MINFLLPGFYEHFKLNLVFCDLIQNHPEFFIDQIHIDAVYGNFQYCPWDGGRIFLNYQHSTAEEVEKICNAFNSRDIPLRFTFTSSTLTEQDYYDRFMETCLEICHNELNEITLVDDNLQKYINNKYPKYSYISSTTKRLTNKELLLKELERPDFKIICLDYDLNHNFNFLETIPIELRQKCEFLVNSICPAGCKNRKEHYRLNSICHQNYNNTFPMTYCPIENNTLFSTPQYKHNRINITEIQEKYLPLGFNHFKLEGRTLTTLEVACNYVSYMIKPELQLFVLEQLIEDVNKLE